VSRVLEAIFRHPLQLFLMVLVAVIAGVAITYSLPRSYVSSASLWALRRYETVGTAGPESDLSSTPAQTQVSALSELLQSRGFALTIARSTNLAATLKLGSASSNPQLVDDALVQNISKHVIVSASGYNVFEISYANSNEQVAQQVVIAVIKQFQLQGENFSILQGQQLLQGYQAQLDAAKKAVDAAVNAESQYLASHPDIIKSGENPLSNPQYALLDTKRQQLQSTMQDLEATIATINGQIANLSPDSGSFFKTLDAPSQPDTAVSRTTLFLEAGGAGAGIALLLCIVYIGLLIRRDRALYSAQDLQRSTGHPVLMQFPHLSLVTMHAMLPDDEI
jgi:hypothetical protein